MGNSVTIIIHIYPGIRRCGACLPRPPSSSPAVAVFLRRIVIQYLLRVYFYGVYDELCSTLYNKIGTYVPSTQWIWLRETPSASWISVFLGRWAGWLAGWLYKLYKSVIENFPFFTEFARRAFMICLRDDVAALYISLCWYYIMHLHTPAQVDYIAQL